MKRIDKLLRAAKQIGGEWQPHDFSITRTESGLYRVFCTLWDGIAGSLRPGKSNMETYREGFFTSKEAAYQGIESYIRTWEMEHATKINPAPNTHDCCLPSTDEERKAVWKHQGRTVMEMLAERAGMTLEQYICKEHPGELEKWLDVIRWRKEDGLDGETPVEIIDAEGS